MNRTAAHSALKRAILNALGQRTDVRIFDNPRGFDRLTKVSYGLAPGATDLIALGRNGKFLALEVKTGKAVPTEDQERFIQMVNDMGHVARVVRSVEDALRALEEALQ